MSKPIKLEVKKEEVNIPEVKKEEVNIPEVKKEEVPVHHTFPSHIY